MKTIIYSLPLHLLYTCVTLQSSSSQATVPSFTLQPYQVAVSTLCVDFSYGVEIVCGPSSSSAADFTFTNSSTLPTNNSDDEQNPEFCENLTSALKFAYKEIDPTFNAELLAATRRGDRTQTYCDVVVSFYVEFSIDEQPPAPFSGRNSADSGQETDFFTSTDEFIKFSKADIHKTDLIREKRQTGTTTITGLELQNNTVLNGGTVAVLLNSQPNLFNSSLDIYFPEFSPYVIDEPISKLISEELNQDDFNGFVITHNITLAPVVELTPADQQQPGDLVRIFYGLEALTCLALNPQFSTYKPGLPCANAIFQPYTFEVDSKTTQIQYLVFDTRINNVVQSSETISKAIDELGQQKVALALGRLSNSINGDMEEYRPDDSGKNINVLGLVFGLIFTVIFIAAIVIGCYLFGKWKDDNNFSSSKSTSTFLSGAGGGTGVPTYMKQQQFGNSGGSGQLTNRFNHGGQIGGHNSMQNSGRFGSMQAGIGMQNGVHNPGLNHPSIYVNPNAGNGLKASVNSASSGYNTSNNGFQSRPVSNSGGNSQPLPSIGQPSRSQAWMDWNKNVAGSNL